MRRGIKKKAGENLSETNIKHVISLLRADKPITKKQACDILKISYNTTRLNSIIEDYESNIEYRNTRKAQNRGKAATKAEIATIAEDYLSGDSIADISKRIFRSAAFVKSIIERVGIPQKALGDERRGIAYLPEECVSENFDDGEVVWSARYHAPCEVVGEESNQEYYVSKYGAKAYKVWVREPSEGLSSGGFFGSQLAYDLGRLKHLQEVGLNVERL
jgi:transposase